MNSKLLAFVKHFCVANHDFVRWDAVAQALDEEIFCFVITFARTHDPKIIKSVEDVQLVLAQGGDQTKHFIDKAMKIASCLQRLDSKDVMPTSDFQQRLARIIFENFFEKWL